MCPDTPIETKNHVDALLQVQQQLEEPHQQKIEIVKVEVFSQVQQQQQQQNEVKLQQDQDDGHLSDGREAQAVGDR